MWGAARRVSDRERDHSGAGSMHAVSARAATHWLYSERTRWAALKPLKRRGEAPITGS